MQAFGGNLDPHFPKKKFKVSKGVPEKNLRGATSGTRAIGSPSLPYITHNSENSLRVSVVFLKFVCKLYYSVKSIH